MKNCKRSGIEGEICRGQQLCVLLDKVSQAPAQNRENLMDELTSIEKQSNDGCLCQPQISEKIMEILKSRNSQ